LVFCFQEGEQFVKKIGGIFAFKVKDGPGGKEATWVVDVKNGKGSVLPNSGQCNSDFIYGAMTKAHKVHKDCQPEMLELALLFSQRAGFRDTVRFPPSSAHTGLYSR
jgi:hypothetical protein